jgi:hypothetical protein
LTETRWLAHQMFWCKDLKVGSQLAYKYIS